jgi:hypothetical protein
MTTPTRAGREGDSQPLPSPSHAPISHRLVQHDIEFFDVDMGPTDLEGLYASLLGGALLLREKMGGVLVTGLAVYGDLEQRLQLGLTRYGQPLRPFNGRNQLLDAYEEVLDALVYLRSAMYEAEHPENPSPPEVDIEATMEDLQHMADTSEPTPVKRASP